MSKNKGNIIINLEFIAAKIGIETVRAMPLRMAYFIANLASRIGFFFDRKHRNRTIKNILHAGITNNYAEAKNIALNNFINLGKVAVEFVKLDQIFTPENINKYVKFNISEEIKQAMSDPRGTVCASAHYGNWEISGLSLSLLFREIVSIGRPMDNPKLSEYIFSKRKSFKQEIYPQDGALKRLLIGLKQHKLLGILIDQHPGDNKGTATTFFSLPVRTHDTPAMLSLKTGAPLLLIVTRRLNDHFHFELLMRGPFTINPSGDMAKDVQILTQKINDELEKIVREDPSQWLWAARRWRDIYPRKSR